MYFKDLDNSKDYLEFKNNKVYLTINNSATKYISLIDNHFSKYIKIQEYILPYLQGSLSIGKSKNHGVVDKYGKVFNHENLFISDASIIHISTLSNPILFITINAIRIAEHIIFEL